MSEHNRYRLALASGRWSIWRECELRSAGFPATDATKLCDRQLANAFERHVRSAESDDGSVQQEYAESVLRMSAVLADFARDPRYREAVALQNLELLRTCLDKLVCNKPGQAARRRQKELVVARYVQRYALKNDTIGFFGPTAWATIAEHDQAIRAEPGQSLLARRTLYFENWAIDTLAQVMACDPDIKPWLAPRLVESNLVEGEYVRRSWGPRIQLTAADRKLLSLCDGKRTVLDIAAHLGRAGSQSAQAIDKCLIALGALRESGFIHLDLVPAAQTWPEAALRAKLLRIADPDVRARMLGEIDGLIDARDEAAAAAGDHQARAIALARLNATFERITRTSPVRRRGQPYAGRTVVYEDTLRDLTVQVGRPVLDALEPLELLLDSARWLVEYTAEAYLGRFRELHDRLRRRTGQDEVPFSDMVSAATPELAFSYAELPALMTSLLSEFQGRWASILQLPAHARRHHVSGRSIVPLVREQFAAGPPRWSAAMNHSPDIMIAAHDAAAINRGEFLLVLGELHLAVNTLENPSAVDQHPDSSQLLAAAEADHGLRRVVPVPSKDSDLVNSRTYPSALLSPHYTYWCTQPNITGAPGRVRPAAELSVVRSDGDLLVRSRRDGQEFDLLEFLGDYLSAIIGNAFKILAPAPHCPRVVIDRLVICRESWTFKAAELDWAFEKSGYCRFRKAWLWREHCAVPERAFYLTPVEGKPIFVDFTSPVFIDMLALAIRRSFRDALDSALTLTEFLPDIEHAWLRDSKGECYTSELRLVAFDSNAAIHT